MDPIEHLLHRVLASEYGLEVQTSDPDKLRQRILPVLRELKLRDARFKTVHMRTPPDSRPCVWIIPDGSAKGRLPSTGAVPESLVHIVKGGLNGGAEPSDEEADYPTL